MAKHAAVFVTGTDTEVGKSRVASALLAAARLQGMSTAAMKPVASGCVEVDGELRNDDALLLLSQCTVALPYEQVNPVALRQAIAPHLAAAAESRRVTLRHLSGVASSILIEGADLTVIEGAGGWRVPINDRELLCDLPRQLNLPVILVVGIRLGCLNHALLTAEAVQRDGLPLIGWVANHLSPATEVAHANVVTLHNLLPAPCLGELPFAPHHAPQDCAGYLDIAPLFAE